MPSLPGAKSADCGVLLVALRPGAGSPRDETEQRGRRWRRRPREKEEEQEGEEGGEGEAESLQHYSCAGSREGGRTLQLHPAAADVTFAFKRTYALGLMTNVSAYVKKQACMKAWRLLHATHPTLDTGQ